MCVCAWLSFLILREMKERVRVVQYKAKNAIDFCCSLSELLQHLDLHLKHHLSSLFTIHPSLILWSLPNHHHHRTNPNVTQPQLTLVCFFTLQLHSPYSQTATFTHLTHPTQLYTLICLSLSTLLLLGKPGEKEPKAKENP